MFKPGKPQIRMGPLKSSKRPISDTYREVKYHSTRHKYRDKIKLLILFCIALIFMGVCFYSLRDNDDPNVLNIAVVILITKDPGKAGGFLDSITGLSLSLDEANSRHSITKIALIHSDVTECIPVLKYFGFQIVSKSLPIDMDEIKNKKYAEALKTDGCCGPLELLKLHVWTMSEYDYVVSMDADMHFHQNFDSIFDAISMNDIPNAKTKDPNEYKGKYLAWTHGASADKNQELINGGFLVVRPNIAHFERMVAIIQEGDFREGGASGSAWKGSGIGWTYGGKTIQGVVPYFYFGEIGKGITDIELDRCIFNVE